MTIPPTACGRTTLRVVRHFAAPSARLASRIEAGTSANTSWVERAIIGTIRIASAKLAFHAAWPWPTTTKMKTKMPSTIAGIPFSTSNASVSTPASFRGASSFR